MLRFSSSSSGSSIFLCFLLLTISLARECVHDHFASNTPRIYYDDLNPYSRRLLQTSAKTTGNLRIFADYTARVTTDVASINLIKRMINISSLLFYNVLTVERLDVLYYPQNVTRECSSVTIPQKYSTQGVNKADVGVVVSDEANPDGASYIAKSTACAFLKSNNRPIWGVMVWNIQNLRFDQEGFQEIVYVCVHEMTHILGFSSFLYEIYPQGNPLVRTDDGDYLNSSKINAEIANHFGCSSSQGLRLQDQDGTSLASHWERKILGNQYMTASNTKNTFLSRFTLALLDSSGWYPFVNYDYAEPSLWGKGKGCSFLDINICDTSPELCSDNSFNCDFDGTAIGNCKYDDFSNQCKYWKYYTNTICIDPSFPQKNLNKKMLANETGGWNSRCFNSNFRARGLQPTTLNYRCYQMKCGTDGKLYIQVGNNVLRCDTPGQVLKAPLFLTGNLTCPKNFDNYCKGKKTCVNNCNMNGICIDGKCLCTGSLTLQKNCLETQLTVTQVQDTAGITYAMVGSINTLGSNIKLCEDNFVFDEEFGECVKCQDYYGCNSCKVSMGGCEYCNDFSRPINGFCNRGR